MIASILIEISLFETKHIASDLIKVFEVHLADKKALTVTHLSDNVTPRINDHWVAKWFLCLVVLTSLRCCDNIALIFDCSSPEQSLPMICTSLRQKFAWSQQGLSSSNHKNSVHFWVSYIKWNWEA